MELGISGPALLRPSPAWSGGTRVQVQAELGFFFSTVSTREASVREKDGQVLGSDCSVRRLS